MIDKIVSHVINVWRVYTKFATVAANIIPVHETAVGTNMAGVTNVEESLRKKMSLNH